MKRAVRMLLRLTASGIITVGGMEFVLEYMRHRLRGTEIHLGNCILGAVLVVLGAILFAFSPRLAERWTDDLDEDE